MSDPRQPDEATPASPPIPPESSEPPASAAAAPRRSRAALTMAALLVALLALGALALAWQTQQRVQTLEQELVRRQGESAGQATEAHLVAKQARERAHEAGAKVALLEERVAESALQRGQLEGLIESLSRSREESLVADIEANVRVAMQHSTLTGSAEPLVAALNAAEERLARAEQPQLESVRRAIARDLERIRAVGVPDIASLAVRLDEAVRLADEAPLRVIDGPLATAGAIDVAASEPAAAADAAPPAAAPASAPAEPASASRWAWLPAGAAGWWQAILDEARGLLRVTRIDQPEAMLLAPEQSYFLRENLKLRLLNARLALQSRQFDTAQADLQSAADAAQRYFDPAARKTQVLVELLRSVAAQAQQAGMPRPDDTLAALAAAAQGQ